MSLSGGYDFSQLYHASLLAYSPGSTFLATAHLNRIIIRSSSTLSIVRTFQCLSQAQLLWSADSLYLLAFSAKAHTAWIFGLTDDGPGDGGEVGRISGDGVEGIVRVEWGRGDRDVLTWSDHGLKLSVYALKTGETSYIQYPKTTSGCHAYSPDSRYLAVVERHSGKDHIGVYDVQMGYHLLRHFPLQTIDAAGLKWSPCGRYLAVQDSALQYSLQIYSPLGPLLSELNPASSSFSSTDSKEDPGLGIRSMTFAPDGRWVAIGGWDGKVRIMESETGHCIAILSLPNRMTDRDTVIWREPADWLKDTRGHGIVSFDRSTSPVNLPAVRPDLSVFPPKAGISDVAFDAEGVSLFARSDVQPNVLHVFNFLPSSNSSEPTSEPAISRLAVLVFSNPIRSARWCFSKRRIAICTKSGGVFFWDGNSGWEEDSIVSADDMSCARGGMMEGVGIPTQVSFIVSDAVWSPDGTSLAILDRQQSQFCLLYEDSSEDPGRSTSSINVSRRWEGNEGLTHVTEEEEVEEDGSVLHSLAEAEALWSSTVPVH